MAINLNFFTMYGVFSSSGPNADVNTANYSSTFQSSLLKTANDTDLPINFSTSTIFKLLLSLLSDSTTQPYLQYYMFGQVGSLSTVMGSYLYNNSNYAQPASQAVMNLMKAALNGSNTDASAVNMLSALAPVVVSDAQLSIYNSSLGSGQYNLALGNTIKNMLTAVLNATDDSYNVPGTAAYNLRSALKTYSNVDVAGIINGLIYGGTSNLASSYSGSTADAIKHMLTGTFNGTDTDTAASDLLAALNKYIANQIYSTDNNIVDAIRDVTVSGNMVNPCYFMINNQMQFSKTTYSNSADLNPVIGPLFAEAAAANPSVVLNSSMFSFSGLIAGNDSTLANSGQNSRSLISHNFANSGVLSVAGYGINSMTFNGILNVPASTTNLAISVFSNDGLNTPATVSIANNVNNVKTTGLASGIPNSGTTLRSTLNNSSTPYLLFSGVTYGPNNNIYRIFVHQTKIQNKVIEAVYIFHSNGLIVMTGEGSVLSIGSQRTWVKQGLSSNAEQLNIQPYSLGVETARGVGTGNAQSSYNISGSVVSSIISTAHVLSQVVTPVTSTLPQTFNLFGNEVAINGSSTNSVVMCDNYVLSYTDANVLPGETYLLRCIKDSDATANPRYYIQVMFNMSTGQVSNIKLLSQDASTVENYVLN